MAEPKEREWRNSKNKRRYNNAMQHQVVAAETDAVNAIANLQTDPGKKAYAESLKDKGDKMKELKQWGAAVQRYREVVDLMTEEKKTKAMFAKELPTYHNSRYDKGSYANLDKGKRARLWNDMSEEFGKESSNFSYLNMSKRNYTPAELKGTAKEVLNDKKKKLVRKKNIPNIQNLDNGELLGMCVRKKPLCSSTDILDGGIWKECQNNNSNCRYSPSLDRNIPSCAKRNPENCSDDSEELLAWRILYDHDMGIHAKNEKYYDAEYYERMDNLPKETKEEVKERERAARHGKLALENYERAMNVPNGEREDERRQRYQVWVNEQNDDGSLPPLYQKTDEERGVSRQQEEQEEEAEEADELANMLVNKASISGKDPPDLSPPLLAGGRRRRKTRAVKRNKKKRTTRKNKNIKKLTKKRRPKKRKGTRKV